MTLALAMSRFETAKQRLCAQHLALFEAIPVYQYPQSAGMVIHVIEVASARLETSGTEVAYIHLSTYICINTYISDIYMFLQTAKEKACQLA